MAPTSPAPVAITRGFTSSKMRKQSAFISAVTIAALMLSGCTIDKERFGSSRGSGQTTSNSSAVNSHPGSRDDGAMVRKPNPTQSAPQPTAKTSRPSAEASHSAELEEAVRKVQSKYSGQLGVALTNPRGDRSAAPAEYGSLSEGPAWSTAKVPVAIAAAKNSGVSAEMRSAITASDNAAADSMWRALGSPVQAGAAATAVLRQGGDQETTIETEVTRPGFSSFGQTRWSLSNQATFGANLQCIAGGTAVSALMGQIAAGQNYGLGSIPGAHFKGGWGPDEKGGYLTRQFGFIPGEKPGTFLGVAIAAKPSDGSYETGQAMLTELAKSLIKLRGFGGTC